MKLLQNIHASHDKQPFGDSCLIISSKSCWRASPIACEIISSLSKKGTRQQFIGELKKIGCADPEKILEKLIQNGFFAEKTGLRTKAWTFMKDPVVPIIKGSWLERLVTNGFVKKIFMPNIIGATFIFYAATVFWTYLLPMLTDRNVILTTWSSLSILWFLLGVLAHELGHSLACAHTGIGFRHIGLTWYLIWPVAYTNVSGIDILDTKRKMIVNLGGIYFQCAFSILIFAVNLAWPHLGFGGAMHALNCLLLINLNPFIRGDAYWCYHDGTLSSRHSTLHNILDRIYEAGYIAFSAYLLYLVGKGTAGFITKQYHQLQSDDPSIGNLLILVILIYLQFLIIRGIMGRLIKIIMRIKNPIST